MSKNKKILNYLWSSKKTLLVLIIATILSTLGIKAMDNLILTASIRESIKKDKSLCPSDMVFVISESGGFCIDEYETSPGPGCPYPNPDNQAETRSNLNDPDCKPVSIVSATPWRNISQDQAVMACAKAGKRLPTNKEWFQAALGTPDPNSNWRPEDCQVAKNWESQPGLTGSGSKCISSAGAYDMIGNVWEWVSGAISEGSFEGRILPKKGYIVSTDGYGLPGMTTPTTPDPNYNQDYLWIYHKGIRAFMRGGYWDNKFEAGQFSVNLDLTPSQFTKGVGFRCAK